MLRKILWGILFFLVVTIASGQHNTVAVVCNAQGMHLRVDQEKFVINGMNWDYIPIGTDALTAEFWKRPDYLISAGLDSEMSLLKKMGINAIRQYTGVPAKWIKYIYENYGIYTMLNHPFGRYGASVHGSWIANTDYSEPCTQESLLSEITDLVVTYKNTPGLLLYLLGNENNYGLFWAGSETEDFPSGEQEKFIGEESARPMYKLMNEAAKRIKAIDASHPVALCNGDVLFLDIIAEECKDIDIFGANVYRGVSFGYLFQVVRDQLDMPIMLTEFGADVFDVIHKKEDQLAQAYYMMGNWQEIYKNVAGLSEAENCIGGFTFQFSDGWWKHDFDHRKNVAIHDQQASWSNGGYAYDFVPGVQNMNEEWFGVCAKGPTQADGSYELSPRVAYYALQEVHDFNPYGDGVTTDSIHRYFESIDLNKAVLKSGFDPRGAITYSNKEIRFGDLKQRYTKKTTDVVEVFNVGKTSFPFTFEDGEEHNFERYQKGATIARKDNPEPKGNSSSKVLTFKKSGRSDQCPGILFNKLGSAPYPLLKTENGTLFKVKIWSPKVGVVVRMGLLGVKDTRAVVRDTVFNVDLVLDTAKEWVTLPFDFADQVGNHSFSYEAILIQPDLAGCGQKTSDVAISYYLDDITQE